MNHRGSTLNTTEAFMARKDPQLHIRVKQDLLDWLKEQAKSNKRSMTAQLELMLEQAKEISGNKKAEQASLATDCSASV